MPSSPTDIFDPEALRRNFADDMVFMGRLLLKFESRYPGQIEAVRAALAKGEGVAAGEAAHRLAGETSVFYSVAARQAALAVEEFARAGQLPEAAAAADELPEHLNQLASALRALVPA